MILNAGEMILFDKSQKDEVLGILSEAGYCFWNERPLSNSTGDKWGIRWTPKKDRVFPNCLATMDYSMANSVRKFGQIDSIESIKWAILEYDDFMARIRAFKPVEIDDLL